MCQGKKKKRLRAFGDTHTKGGGDMGLINKSSLLISVDMSKSKDGLLKELNEICNLCDELSRKSSALRFALEAVTVDGDEKEKPES